MKSFSLSVGNVWERRGKEKRPEGLQERREERREELTMASKETAAAGFSNVSREITGEFHWTFLFLFFSFL